MRRPTWAARRQRLPCSTMISVAIRSRCRIMFRRALVAYTRYVIDEEWPLHQKGELPRNTERMIEAAQRAILAFEPVSETQKIVQAQVLQAHNNLLEAHWRRVQAFKDTALPVELWVVVTRSAPSPSRRASCYAWTASLCMRRSPCWLRRRLRWSCISLRSATIPFRGASACRGEPYQAVLDKMVLPDAQHGK